MNPYAPPGQVTEADVRAAQTILDALQDSIGVQLEKPDASELRGMLTAWAAEVRGAGYAEGVLRGRKQVAAWVTDALAGEGL